jgi:Ca2+-binding RTX toxin-like protein
MRLRQFAAVIPFALVLSSPAEVLSKGGKLIFALERRSHLSITTSLEEGVLTVYGTSGRDRIYVEVLENGVTVKDAGAVVYSTPPGSTDITREIGLVVNANSGADRILVYSYQASFITLVYGQSGHDRITLRSYHGPGGRISGGPGDDTMASDTQLTDSDQGAELHGKQGNDTIVANSGSGAQGSLVFGGSGDDDITVISKSLAASGNASHGDSGSDTIRGGDLADDLFADGDDDVIFGGGGDDWLLGGLGRDQIDGGAGTDRADDDTSDTVLNVETFT